MTDTPQIGDVVSLNSGGQMMTVLKSQWESYWECGWIWNGELCTAVIPQSCLRKFDLGGEWGIKVQVPKREGIQEKTTP